jgi:arylsulfatase A-like enzyme
MTPLLAREPDNREDRSFQRQRTEIETSSPQNLAFECSPPWTAHHHLQSALNIDLTPTVAALPGASAPDFADGRSLEPLLNAGPPATWRRAFLIEDIAGDAAGADSGATPPYRALRARDRLYVEYDSGERELYDLVADPDQLDNLMAETNPRLIDSLSTRLTELTRCEGPGCRVADDAALDRFGST